MLAGIVCGFWFYGVQAGYLARRLNRPLANLLGFLLVFGAFVIVGALVAKLASTLFKWVGLFPGSTGWPAVPSDSCAVCF